MEAGVSVFNKAASLPPNCQTWSVIPKGHLKWFEAIFEHGERSAPPNDPGTVTAQTGPVTPKIIASTERFELKTTRAYPNEILACRSIKGTFYALTKGAVYAEQKEIEPFVPQSGYTGRRNVYDFCLIQNDQPAFLTFNPLQGHLHYRALSGKLEGHMETTGFFVSQDRLYTVEAGKLLEHTLLNLGAKPLLATAAVGQIFHQHTVYPGVVVQDVLGTCRLTLPSKAGASVTLHVKELDKTRILDAKAEKGFAILLVENQGRFDRITLVFDQTWHYTLRKEENVDLHEIDFTVMDKGICVAQNQDTIEIFATNDKVKKVDQSPLLPGQKLFSESNQIFAAHKNEILQISLKA
jgi:hypothetical protein